MTAVLFHAPLLYDVRDYKMRTFLSPEQRTIDDDATTLHVALLRGINVGGKNRLPMPELAALFAGAGCSRVQTYLQSGNVIFTADDVAGLEIRLTRAIESQFGLRVPLVVRNAEEIRRAVRGNPFVKARVPEEMLHVYFLAGAPNEEALSRLDTERSPGDTYMVVGREIYLHLPGGVARTKLTNAYFDRALSTVSTMRNWKTCLALSAIVCRATSAET